MGGQFEESGLGISEGNACIRLSVISFASVDTVGVQGQIRGQSIRSLVRQHRCIWSDDLGV